MQQRSRALLVSETGESRGVKISRCRRLGIVQIMNVYRRWLRGTWRLRHG
jgi:hypothetical protein